MLKKIGIFVAVLMVGLVGVVMAQPSTFRIERSKTIDAPDWVVFNIVNDLRRWPAWSPWEKLDPNMKKTHSGSEVGKGSVYEWSGNEEVGTGRMTIVEGTPPKKIAIKLEFMEPWEATSTTLFTFDGKGKQTNMTWAMEGENDFMAKAASLFMNMDEMVGKDFEAGLDQLKKIAEVEAREIERRRSREVEAKEAEAAADAAALPDGEGADGDEKPAAE